MDAPAIQAMLLPVAARIDVATEPELVLSFCNPWPQQLCSPRQPTPPDVPTATVRTENFVYLTRLYRILLGVAERVGSGFSNLEIAQ